MGHDIPFHAKVCAPSRSNRFLPAHQNSVWNSFAASGTGNAISARKELTLWCRYYAETSTFRGLQKR